MLSTRKLFVTLWILAAVALVPSAEAVEVELTPTLAYRTGGFSCEGSPFNILAEDISVFPPPTCAGVRAEAEDDLAIGMILGVEVARGLQVEVLLNRQESEVQRDFVFPFNDLVVGLPEVQMEITHLQVGLSKTWERGAVHPFVGAAVGVSRLDADDPAFLLDFREDPFSASVGAGIKTFFDERFGMRFEARGYWVDLDDEFGGDFTQEELAVGAILRW